MGFHCGNTCSGKLTSCSMKYQLIMARSLPEEVTQGTLEGDIVPGDITFFRLQSTADCRLRAYVAQGEVLPVATRSFGAIGIFAIPEMGRFYRHVLVEKNYPHHGAVAFGHYGKALYEVFKYLGVEPEEFGFNQPKGMRYPTVGTSAVKLLLMDGAGKIQKIVSKEYPLYFPHPGWSEQNPEDWYEKSMEGLKELLSGCDKSQVAGISFGGQMHGLVILDKDDQVIRPAILWNDGRTGEETDYLNQVIGKDKLSAYTANIAFAGFTAPKILWVKKHEPENFARIEKLMLPKDYLAYRLSGTFCTDVSDASGMLLFDVEHKRWSKEMMEICGVKESQLAEIFESYETVGTLKPELAAELGLSENVKIAAGAGDNAAAAVGEREP